MKLSKKDFINYAGIKSPGNFSQYVSRGKIIVESDGTIDIDLKHNRDWLQSRASKGITPEFTAVKLGVSPTTNQTQKSVKASSDKYIEPIELNEDQKKKVTNSIASRHEVELKKLVAELEKKLVDTELAREKLATIKGSNVPVSIVKDIMSQLSKSIINNYKSFSEQQISQICHKYRIDEQDRVKLVSQNVNGLNRIHEKAVNEAKKQFKASVGITREEKALEDDGFED
jgi:hypothetical protein